MVEPYSLQESLSRMQNSDEIASIFGKIVSGKAGYKPVIEKKKEVLRCEKCGKILEGIEKFCPECGNKIEKKTN